MRRTLLVLAALLFAAFATWRALRALAPPEAHVRRRLAAMAEGFDRARLRPIADGLAPEYRDETSGCERAVVLDLFRSLYLEHVRGPFPYDVELPEDLVAIAVDPSGDAATATFVAELARLSGGEREPAWSVEIEAELRRADGAWRLVRTRHRTLSGDSRRLR